MFDPTGQGYFEGPAEWAVRAGHNLMAAAQIGITVVRAVAETSRVDLAWRHRRRGDERMLVLLADQP
jgi:hypothetical protein